MSVTRNQPDSSTIHHYRHREQYTRCHNDTIRDRELSWKATGMLMYLLSLPENWKVNLIDLASRKTDGDTCTRAALAELVERGYVRRRQIRKGNRIEEWRTEVREGLDLDWDDPLDVGNQHVEIQHVGNHPPKKELKKKDLEKNEPTTISRTDRFDEFWETYPLKKGKGAARKAWAKIKVDPDLVIAAALAYRDDPNRDDDFTKWPQGWLNDERWDDELLPSVPHHRQTRTQRNLIGMLTEDRPSREERFRAAGALDTLETSGRPALVGLTANGRRT